MSKVYEYPVELPKISLEDGIIIEDYGTILISVDHIYHSKKKVRKLVPTGKVPVIIIGEGGRDISGELLRAGDMPEVLEVVSALAIVSTVSFGRVLANVYLGLQSNPFPTKAFDGVEGAKRWIKSLSLENV